MSEFDTGTRNTVIKIFYKNIKDVGMAYKGQKQVKAVTQRSINHGPYMQDCRTI